MSSVMIFYTALAIAMLRVALVHEMLARQAARQRLEKEFHRALTRMLVASGQRTRRIR